MSKKRYWKTIETEQQKAYYQYSMKNGVSKEEAAKACNYAKSNGINPKNLTPKSQLACGNALAYGTSSGKKTSCTSSSNSASANNTSSTSNTDFSTVLKELMNMLRNLFDPNNQNNIYNNSTNNNEPPQGDPDKYAKQYAKENHISLEQARAQLQNMYGSPEEKNSMSEYA